MVPKGIIVKSKPKVIYRVTMPMSQSVKKKEVEEDNRMGEGRREDRKRRSSRKREDKNKN